MQKKKKKKLSKCFFFSFLFVLLYYRFEHPCPHHFSVLFWVRRVNVPPGFLHLFHGQIQALFKHFKAFWNLAAALNYIIRHSK